MSELSPAAQAVLDAYNREAKPEPHHQREAIAAALRALVAHAYSEAVEIRKAPGFVEFDEAIRTSEISALATELETHQ